MKIRTFFVFAVFSLVLSIPLANANPTNPIEEYVPYEILVKFKASISEADRVALRYELGAKLVKTIKSIRVEQWELPKTITTEEAIEVLRQNPLIEYVEPNYLYKPHSVPNDAYFNQLWALHNTGQNVNGFTGTLGADISAVEAWDITTGSHSVIIAVIDSGVAFDHPDLQNNIWTNEDEIPDNFIDDDGNGYIDDVHGYDFVNLDGNPSDYSSLVNCNGHGTHVAGTIASEGNNSIGTTGVMWSAQIMPIQIFDLFQPESTSYYDFINNLIIDDFKIISAIEYAVDNGAKIINCSFGGSLYSQSQYDILSYAKDKGVLVVCSAGNDGSNNDFLSLYPASHDLPNIISVAATDEDDKLASYSNYGSTSVDVAAPGGNSYGSYSNIYSTTPPERERLFYDNFETNVAQWWTDGIFQEWEVNYSSIFASKVAQDSLLNYYNNENSYIRTLNPVHAENCRGMHLQYTYAYALENGFDFVYIQASFDGINWFDTLTYTGFNPTPTTHREWLSDVELTDFYFGFNLRSDDQVNSGGFSVDDILITGVPWIFDGSEYDYMSGTSMAAPVVSGIAGLLLSYNPNLSHLELKNAIVSSVDKLDSLKYKVASGGRVNALKALQSVDEDPVDNDALVPVLYFPHVSTRTPWQTEIAVINTDANQTATGTLSAYNNTGQFVEAKNISLAPHGRRQITIANEFTNHPDIGYIILYSNTSGIQGYTKFFQNSVYRTAIPAVIEVNDSEDIYISHIASNNNFWTGISLVNNTAATKNLTINFNDGRSAVVTIGGWEHKIFTIAGLFGGQPQPTIKSGVITNASGIIGLELFGNDTQLDGILLTDNTVSTIYYPHVADMTKWWTGIVAYNPSSIGCNISITPYTENGTALPTVDLPLAGKEKYVGVVKSLGLDAQTAWFKIDSTRPLSGFELFGTLDGNLLAAYAEGSGTGAKSGVFAKIEKSGWTGIAFVNTEGTTASVTLTAYNDNGGTIATSTINVGGHAKVVNVAENIFAQQNISSATYITYTSNRNVVGFQLNGSSDGKTLDGLPALKAGQ